VKQEVIAGQFLVPSHPGVLKNVNINGNVLQRYFSHKTSQGCQQLWPACFGEKHVFHNVIYFQFFCQFFEWKIKRINNADLFFTASFDHIYQGCHQFWPWLYKVGDPWWRKILHILSL